MKEKLALSSRPSVMRLILAVSSVLVILLTIALIFFSRNYLISYANDVATITAASQDTQETIDSLARAKSELADQDEIVQKAKRIVADSKQYQYQNQIISDLTAYAKEANLSISSFVFGNSTNTSNTKGKVAGETVAGLKTAEVTIGLPNQIPYSDLLKFLSLIENNATRMQVEGLLISPVTSSSSASVPTINTSDMVTVNSLTIGVYIK